MRGVILLISLGFGLAIAQTPKFEVAFIKPSDPGASGCNMSPARGNQQYISRCLPIRTVLWVAYWLKASQVAGGPDWINTDRFDILGQAEATSSIDDLHVMMQNLLVERFMLQSHREQRNMQAYVLTADPSRTKSLERHDTQNASEVRIDPINEGPNHEWTARSAPMDFFVFRLAQLMDRPIVNQTGLAGGYDFHIEFSDELPMTAPPLTAAYPTIFDALQQLGLKLESRRAMVDVLVIDHIDRPTEN